MNEPFYDFQIGDNALEYTFLSEGLRPVTKLVAYAETDLPGFFNLSLADLEPDGVPNYLSVTNNGDLEVMMATVAQTLLDFFRQHPTASVAFSGSTPARTRLYQAALARQVRAASADFVILGLRDGLLEPFQLNYPYDGFVISFPNQLPSDESPAN